MNTIKKAIVGYFVYYGVTSFLANLAQQYIQQQVVKAKLDGLKPTDIAGEAKNRGQYL